MDDPKKNVGGRRSKNFLLGVLLGQSLVLAALPLSAAADGEGSAAVKTAEAKALQIEHRLLIELHRRPVYSVISDPKQKLWESEQPDVKTAVMVIESDAVLSLTVSELGLVEVLKDELEDTGDGEMEAACVNWLRDHISCDDESTRLVEIWVGVPERLAKSKLAPARLANGIARSYNDYVEQGWRDHGKRILEEMKMESKAQEKLAEESRVVFIDLLKDSDLNDVAKPGEQEIMTPLMHVVRSGFPVDKEVAEKLLDERRRVVEAQAAKDEYLLHRARLLLLKDKIADGEIAMKMPVRYVTLHD